MRKRTELLAAALLPACARLASAAPEAAAAAAPGGDSRTMVISLSAAATMSICVLGSAYAVARIGAAAMGAAAEKPELLVRSLLFVALAEGLAVLGFVIATMMLGKI